MRPIIGLWAAGTLAVALALAPARASAAELHGVPLPRGSKVVGEGQAISGRSLRDSVDHVRRFLDRSGLPHQAIPLTRYRGVTLARFVRKAAPGHWTAIHVFSLDGKVRISVVLAKDPLDAPQKSG